MSLSDLEINAMADGVFKYLAEKTDSPLDGLAIVGILMLKLFDCKAEGSPLTIEQFAKDFAEGLVETHKAQSFTHEAPERIQ